MPGKLARALVVDDNEEHRDLIGAILASQGLDVTYAADGEQAVKAVKASDFGLILMDLNMPGMGGVAATKLIRNLEAGTGAAPARIYFVTAWDATPVRRLAELVGADGYITKPIDFAKLVAVAGGVQMIAAFEPEVPARLQA